MKNKYISPEFEHKKIVFTVDALIISSTNPTATDSAIPTEGKTVPDDDPFS